MCIRDRLNTEWFEEYTKIGVSLAVLLNNGVYENCKSRMKSYKYNAMHCIHVINNLTVDTLHVAYNGEMCK